MHTFAELMMREPRMREFDGSPDLARPLFSLLITLVIAGVFVYAIRTMAKNHETIKPADPLTLAQTRFANGEISKDELHDIKKTLNEK